MPTAVNRVRARSDREAINRPLPSWLRGRRRQRVFTIAWAALLLAYAVLRVRDDGLAGSLAFLPAMALQWPVMRAGRIATGTFDAGLDERQRSVRGHAHKLAYGTIMTLVALAWFALEVLGRGFLEADLDGETIIRAIFPLFFFLWGLPAAIVVWIEPDAAEA